MTPSGFIPDQSSGSGQIDPLKKNTPEAGGTGAPSAIPEEPGVSPGLRVFAAHQLIPKLDAFSREIEGVRAGEDIEYIHRMRVASRRLRAALPLFFSCFLEKHYKQWLYDIRQVTRLLSDARDADVQIASLKKYRKKLVKRQERSEGIQPPEDALLMEGIQYLTLRTRKKRDRLQKNVISALDVLEKDHVIERIREVVSTGAGFTGRTKKKPSMMGIPPIAASHIAKGVDAVLSYGQWAQYPDAVAEHHAMRIAAKELRYMMEIYAPLYRRGLSKPIARVTKLQTILGELHDCDVWIDVVTLILLRERARLRSQTGASRPGHGVISGLKLFLRDREKERKVLYRRFSYYWNSLNRADFWGGVRSSLISQRKAIVTPPSGVADEKLLRAVNTLSLVYPEGLVHERHVTTLALQLYDCLQSLHRMPKRSRLLLESAALLHDIGWRSGEKGHPARGARMILSDDQLPFDIAERGIIALAAFAHRGKVRIQSCGIYRLLSPEEQQVSCMIASIIRIADGLDCRRNGIVRAIACHIEGQEITLRITGTEDTGPERQKALRKAKLFIQLSGHSITFS